MKRKELAELMVWKADTLRKPLIINGARQTGKTWLMKEFGKTSFESVAYINFESSPVMRTVFTQDYNITRILTAIQIETGVQVIAGKTLLILDEIQEAPQALTSLKYFAENAPELHVLAAGSLMGILLGKGNSFPVGKVAFMPLFPMSFTEFLEANENQLLANAILQADWATLAPFHEKLVSLLKIYFFTGGMPEAIQTWVTWKDTQRVRDIHLQILNAYEQDFAKHAPPDIIPRIRMVWNGIPAQLAKENRKFIYGQLKQGARAKEFEMALLWLKDNGLVYKVHNVTKPGFPLKAYEDAAAFKLFTLDTGLLAAMSGLDASTLLGGNTLFEEFKGALTEQYVLQQLLSVKRGDVYYFSEQNTRSEIDFLIQANKTIIPVEVKASENLKAKSLKVYCEKYNPQVVIRTSLSPFRQETWLTNLPLFAIQTAWGS
jgi:predicted AAA+ superfamily ATPase